MSDSVTRTQSGSTLTMPTHGLEPSILKIFEGSDNSAVIWMQVVDINMIQAVKD